MPVRRPLHGVGLNLLVEPQHASLAQPPQHLRCRIYEVVMAPVREQAALGDERIGPVLSRGVDQLLCK